MAKLIFDLTHKQTAHVLCQLQTKNDAFKKTLRKKIRPELKLVEIQRDFGFFDGNATIFATEVFWKSSGGAGSTVTSLTTAEFKRWIVEFRAIRAKYIRMAKNGSLVTQDILDFFEAEMLPFVLEKVAALIEAVPESARPSEVGKD